MLTNSRVAVEKPRCCPLCEGSVSIGFLELIGQIYLCNICGFVIGHVRTVGLKPAGRTDGPEEQRAGAWLR